MSSIDMTLSWLLACASDHVTLGAAAMRLKTSLVTCLAMGSIICHGDQRTSFAPNFLTGVWLRSYEAVFSKLDIQYLPTVFTQRSNGVDKFLVNRLFELQ